MTPPHAITEARPTRLTIQPERRASTRLLTRLLEPRAWCRVRALVDVVVLYAAASIALLADPDVGAYTANRWSAALFPALVLVLLQWRPDQERRLAPSLIDVGVQAVAAVSLAAMITIAASSVLGDTHAGPLALRLWLFATVYLGTGRMVLLSLRRHLLREPALATPAIVVGAGLVGERVARHLLAEPLYGVRPVGFVDSNPRDSVTPTRAEVPILGGIHELEDVVERTGARRVILAFNNEPDRVLAEKIGTCVARGAEVSLVPRLFEQLNERTSLDHLGGLPLLSLQPTDPHGWQFAVKHTIDRVFAVLALLLLSPLMGGIALAVRFSSPGPIFFRQRRVGRDGRIFDLLKFRTMLTAEGEDDFEPEDGRAPGGVEGADRRTPVGHWLRRTSLDELPQFINVLRGDMSIVGPRPERPEYVTLFTQHVERYEHRHRVKSGITGWAQVKGLRGPTSIRDRVDWDNYYIQNWSLRLDLKIMALTVFEVLRLRG